MAKASSGGSGKGISRGGAGGSTKGAAEELLGGVGQSLAKMARDLLDLVNTIKPFVQALSPSTILAFQQAIKDLHATIGTAFVGVFQILTSAVREAAGVLLPLMQRLKPMFDTLANLFINFWMPVLRLVASALASLAPALQLFSELFNEYAKMIGDFIGLLSAAIKTLANFVSMIFGLNRETTLELFKAALNGLREVVKALVVFGATLARLAGAADVVRDFSRALADEARARDARAAGVMAAATNAQIGDLAALVKQAQQAAFIAAGGIGVREKTDTEWLKSIARSVEEAAKGRTLLGMLTQWWTEEVLHKSLLGTVLTWLNNLRNNIESFFR